MKVEVSITHISYNSWEDFTVFLTKDLRSAVTLRHERESSMGDWEYYNNGSLVQYLPNLVECSWRDEWESVMFQKSLVWDSEVPFYLLMEIQKFVYGIISTGDYISLHNSQDSHIRVFEY